MMKKRLLTVSVLAAALLLGGCSTEIDDGSMNSSQGGSIQSSQSATEAMIQETEPGESATDLRGLKETGSGPQAIAILDESIEASTTEDVSPSVNTTTFDPADYTLPDYSNSDPDYGTKVLMSEEGFKHAVSTYCHVFVTEYASQVTIENYDSPVGDTIKIHAVVNDTTIYGTPANPTSVNVDFEVSIKTGMGKVTKPDGTYDVDLKTFSSYEDLGVAAQPQNTLNKNFAVSEGELYNMFKKSVAEKSSDYLYGMYIVDFDNDGDKEGIALTVNIPQGNNPTEYLANSESFKNAHLWYVTESGGATYVEVPADYDMSIVYGISSSVYGDGTSVVMLSAIESDYNRYSYIIDFHSGKPKFIGTLLNAYVDSNGFISTCGALSIGGTNFSFPESYAIDGGKLVLIKSYPY
ncbi:hypothetical protein SAMN02745229_03708 [Butyrivibrio fibrisolvens DSM 3071]|uniref:Uncharacterized protein n=1 Tax=Butyrivibrio fibrisolvens DSM 3071 TaxID=1121131 RepID=A0A1M6EC77_BUTFI|nr:hypothetical protein [Butyrivibrio fibrisolvens]SHI83075.1 hypothetical protein SAMN02745229_03708 [Butyrivibrio fibrisolvens DSM 3071]